MIQSVLSLLAFVSVLFAPSLSVAEPAAQVVELPNTPEIAGGTTGSPRLTVLVGGAPAGTVVATAILSNGRFAGWMWRTEGSSNNVISVDDGNPRSLKIFSPGKVELIPEG